MTETERKTTVCTKCGQEVGTAKFCPYCGAKVEAIPTDKPPLAPKPEETPISHTAVESKPARPTFKERWHALPLWRRVVPIVTIVACLAVMLAIPVSNAIEDARRKARIEAWEAEKAAESAAAEELEQKQRQELVDLWNAYAAHDPNGPTKGKQLTMDMAEDRVVFGSGWVEFGVYDGYISLYYHAEQLISEADISALGAIFSNEAGMQKLTREFQSYNASIRDREERPHGADHVDFKADFDTKDIIELEFSDPYARYLNSSSTETYYSNQVSEEDYLAFARQIISQSLISPSSAIYSDEVVEETDKYGRRLVTLSVDAQNVFGAIVQNHYAVIIQYADTEGHFTWRTDFGAQQYSTSTKASVIDIMKNLNGWGLPFEPYEYNGPDTAQEPSQSPATSSSNSDPLALSYLDGWSWEANNGDGTSATLREILDYELLGPSFTATENKADGTVIVEDETSGLAIVFSADGGEPTIPPRSAVSEEEFVALCEDYMNVLRGVQTQ